MFLFGMLLVWSKIRDEVWGPIPGADRVTWYGLVFGVCAMLRAPWAIYGLVRSLRARRRLIVGVDRIQLVELAHNDDSVVLQIPYSNFAEVKYEATRSHRRVGIDLLDLNDPETYAPGTNFESRRRAIGRHFCITVGYEGGPSAIASAIIDAIAKWRSEAGNRGHSTFSPT